MLEIVLLHCGDDGILADMPSCLGGGESQDKHSIEPLSVNGGLGLTTTHIVLWLTAPWRFESSSLQPIGAQLVIKELVALSFFTELAI